MIGLLAGSGVFLISIGMRRPPSVDVVGRYFGQDGRRSERSDGRPFERVLASGSVGAVCGVALVPGNWVVGVVLGGVGGVLGDLMIKRRTRERRGRRLGFELPAIADLLALYLLSGESVLGALRMVHRDATGVAAAEIGIILEGVDAGSAFPEAVRTAARVAAHDDAQRLYEMLAQAHRSGSRLVDALEIFAADRRSAIAGEMTEEGGRRALVGYGPILGLMIPTTLAFLIYPTLAGLDALAATN